MNPLSPPASIHISMLLDGKDEHLTLVRFLDLMEALSKIANPIPFSRSAVKKHFRLASANILDVGTSFSHGQKSRFEHFAPAIFEVLDPARQGDRSHSSRKARKIPGPIRQRQNY
jgi:hypothetical protein